MKLKTIKLKSKLRHPTSTSTFQIPKFPIPTVCREIPIPAAAREIPIPAAGREFGAFRGGGGGSAARHHRRDFLNFLKLKLKLKLKLRIHSKIKI